MTAQSWRSHYEQKYQYSLRLFLLLNLVSSVLSLVSPLFTVITFTLPCFLIVACSTVLLLWHCKFSQHKINIPVISLLFGLLWAWHVALKAMVMGPPHFNYLVIALLSVLFIGTIALFTHIPYLPDSWRRRTMAAHVLVLSVAYCRYHPAKPYSETQRCIHAGAHG